MIKAIKKLIEAWKKKREDAKFEPVVGVGKTPFPFKG